MNNKELPAALHRLSEAHKYLETNFKKLNQSQIPCKFANHYNDWVSVPFGSGNCAMPGFECTYDGDKEIPYDCEENNKCPLYQPVKTLICSKHNQEYVNFCPICEQEMEKQQEEAEAKYLEIAKEMEL